MTMARINALLRACVVRGAVAIKELASTMLLLLLS